MPGLELHQFMRDFRNTIRTLIENKVYSHVLFLCIGTDCILGDSFGPIVGHKLQEKYQEAKNIHIIGNFEHIVCNKNMEQVGKEIEKNYANPFIIAIDSALSYQDKMIGKVIVSNERD